MRYANLVGRPIVKEARLAPTRYVDQFAKAKDEDTHAMWTAGGGATPSKTGSRLYIHLVDDHGENGVVSGSLRHQIAEHDFKHGRGHIGKDAQDEGNGKWSAMSDDERGSHLRQDHGMRAAQLRGGPTRQWTQWHNEDHGQARGASQFGGDAPYGGHAHALRKAQKRFTNVCSSNSCQHVQDFATKREAEGDATSHAKMNQNPHSPHDVSIVDNAVAKVFGEAKCRDCGTQYNDAAEGDKGRCEVCQDKLNAERYGRKAGLGAK